MRQVDRHMHGNQRCSGVSVEGYAGASKDITPDPTFYMSSLNYFTTLIKCNDERHHV